MNEKGQEEFSKKSNANQLENFPGGKIIFQMEPGRMRI